LLYGNHFSSYLLHCFVAVLLHGRKNEENYSINTLVYGLSTRSRGVYYKPALLVIESQHLKVEILKSKGASLFLSKSRLQENRKSAKQKIRTSPNLS
jgi:hypothetical protein